MSAWMPAGMERWFHGFRKGGFYGPIDGWSDGCMDGWWLDGCTEPVWETKAALYNAGVMVMQSCLGVGVDGWYRNSKQIQMIQWLENCPW